MAFLALTVVISFAAGLGAFYLARGKGRSMRPWVFASVILWFPVLILALLPPRRKTHDALSNG